MEFYPAETKRSNLAVSVSLLANCHFVVCQPTEEEEEEIFIYFSSFLSFTVDGGQSKHDSVDTSRIYM